MKRRRWNPIEITPSSTKLNHDCGALADLVHLTAVDGA